MRLSGARPQASQQESSPWAGLSGAALFAGDLLVGVIVIDTPSFRSGRLTAVPMWRLLDDPGYLAAVESHGCHSHWEAVELADLFERRQVRLTSPASLLRADAGVVAFRGRAELLERLRTWCAESAGLSGQLAVGPGGQGKTRPRAGALRRCA